MFNFDKSTLIAGAAIVAAGLGLAVVDHVVSEQLINRRVAKLMEELKLTIEDFLEMETKTKGWTDYSEEDKILRIERLVAHDILDITNMLDTKVVVRLRKAVTDEIKLQLAK